MSAAKITKNVMVNLPVKIREKLGVEPGDKIAFVERGGDMIVVPIRGALEIASDEHYERVVEMIDELHEERRNEE